MKFYDLYTSRSTVKNGTRTLSPSLCVTVSSTEHVTTTDPSPVGDPEYVTPLVSSTLPLPHRDPRNTASTSSPHPTPCRRPTRCFRSSRPVTTGTVVVGVLSYVALSVVRIPLVLENYTYDHEFFPFVSTNTLSL